MQERTATVVAIERRRLRDDVLKYAFRIVLALFWVPAVVATPQGSSVEPSEFDWGVFWLACMGWLLTLAVLYVVRTVGRIADVVVHGDPPDRR